MSHGRLRIVTEEDRERLHTARRQDGMCAWCGKMLGGDETVYMERCLMGTRRLRGSDLGVPLTYRGVRPGEEGRAGNSRDSRKRRKRSPPELVSHGCGATP